MALEKKANNVRSSSKVVPELCSSIVAVAPCMVVENNNYIVITMHSSSGMVRSTSYKVAHKMYNLRPELL